MASVPIIATVCCSNDLVVPLALFQGETQQTGVQGSTSCCSPMLQHEEHLEILNCFSSVWGLGAGSNAHTV